MVEGRFYVRARVDVGGLILEEPKSLPIGSRFEGYSIPPNPPDAPPFSPMTAVEARRLYGEDIVTAIEMREIDLDAIDWTLGVIIVEDKFDEMSWLEVSIWNDDEKPVTVWLPFFAHLLRVVEQGNSLYSHLSTLEITVANGLEQALPTQIELTALLFAKLQDVLIQSPYVRISELLEATASLHLINLACLRARESKATPGV